MKIRALLASSTLVGAGLLGPGLAPADAVGVDHSDAAKHKCTRTSSGSCIKGGQFCPKAKYGKSGWDAKGRRYVCKGNRSHPHWMRP